jgi:Ca-activated chloride channel family protein
MSVLNFVNLYGAWFFLSLIPLVILYFLKLRRPKLEVPSLVLWQSVVNDQRVNSPFQKFRRNLLLLLQILLLCLLVLALMQPFLPTTAGVAQYTPLLIDCSASMSARDEATGRTRLELVLQQVREQIENLSGDQQLAIFTFASTGRRLTEFTNDRRVLLKALEKIEASDLPAQLDDVLRMAAAYSTSFPIESVTVLTDGNLPERVDFELPFRLDVRRVDVGGPNLGITEMSARRSGADEWEVFVRVAGSSDDLRGAELQIFENGQQTHSETMEVSQQDAERLVFPVTTGAATLLEARLVPAGFDAMATDNSVWLSLPATRPLKALVSDKLATWKRAIGIVPNVTVEDLVGEVPAGSEYDLIVTREAVVPGVSAPIRIVVGGIPEDLATQVSRKDDVSSVIDWNRTAPLLRHVQLADVQVGEQPAWGEGVTVRDLEARGYEVLIDGNAGPLLLQKREGLQTTWWFTFDTDRSTLPFRVGFPILVANAVDAALKQAALSEVSAAPTGVLPALSLEADRDYVVTTPRGEQLAGRSGATGLLTGIPAARVGRYSVAEGQDTVAVVGTGLLSVTETSLAAVEELRFSEATVATGTTETLETDRPLWWTLALVAFGLLMFEWWYFQRARGAVE